MDEKEVLQMVRDCQAVRKLVRRLDPALALGLLTGVLGALLVLKIIEDEAHQSRHR